MGLVALSSFQACETLFDNVEASIDSVETFIDCVEAPHHPMFKVANALVQTVNIASKPHNACIHLRPPLADEVVKMREPGLERVKASLERVKARLKRAEAVLKPLEAVGNVFKCHSMMFRHDCCVYVAAASCPCE